MSEYAIFAKRIGLVGVAQTIVRLKGLIILPILTKTLGTSDYGIWAQIFVTISLLQPFIILGLDSSILRFLSSSEKEKVVQGIISVLFVVTVIGTAASLILFLSSDFIATTFLRDGSAAFAIKIASPLIIVGALNTVLLGSFRVFGQIKRYSIMILLQSFLEVVLVAIFVLFGYGLIGAIISILITQTVIFGIMLYLIIFCAGFISPDFSILRPYLIYGLPLIPTVVFQFVIASSDRYIIGFFMGAEKVGIYSAAYSIGGIVLMFSAYIMYILRPTIYSIYDKKRADKVKIYLSYSWKCFLMLSIPSAFGLSILSEPLLSSLTTPEFVSSGKFVIPLVALGTIFYGVEMIFGAVLMLVKRTNVFVIVFGTAAVANLGLNILFVPCWGIIGAAITTLIAYTIAAIGICYKSRQYMKFDIKLDFIVKCILASIVMALGIWVLDPVGIVEILVAIGIGAIVYSSLLFLLRAFDKKELKMIGEIVRLR